MKTKVDYICGAAELLGHTLTWDVAKAIADKFTLGELQRIYLRIQGAGSRRIYAKKAW